MGIHKAVSADELDAMARDATKTIDLLSGYRRWQDVAAISALIAHAQISRSVANHAQIDAARWRAQANDHELSTLAIGESRRLLDLHGVPDAAFFDDHVMNAVVQRNLMGKLVGEVLDWALDRARGAEEDPELRAFAEGVRQRRAELGYVEKDDDRVGERGPDPEADPGAA